MARKRKLAQADIDMDLTPMIDVIFLLIIFFILAGRITSEISNTNITVPPTKTAEKWEKPDDWGHIKIEVWGTTQDHVGGGEPGFTIKMGLNPEWHSTGSHGDAAFNGYQKMRGELNEVFDRADKYTDPVSGIKLPKVVVELRSDGDTEYRVVQEIQQVATDTVNPYADKQGQYMKPSTKPPAQMRPFVNFQFTTRKPGD
ncbi:MAG: biopolymer transporter ExbD [Planctomycetota bacterium]|jgi:hypothetical protein|nr:biopolymer transporter ExbD [Planctomycetota bacterium]